MQRTSSQLHLFQVCFFCWLFLFLNFFFFCVISSPRVSFQQNPSSEEQFVYVTEALEVLSV